LEKKLNPDLLDPLKTKNQPRLVGILLSNYGNFKRKRNPSKLGDLHTFCP
jgi:hypothetical protein